MIPAMELVTLSRQEMEPEEKILRLQRHWGKGVAAASLMPP